MSGKGDKVKGRIKEATGVLIGDKELEREGKIDTAVGKVKDTVEKVVEKVRGAVDSARDAVKRPAK